MKIIISNYLRNKKKDKNLIDELERHLSGITNQHLKDGYAPFCKNVFISNEIGLKPTFMQKFPWVYPYIQSEYNSRREDELPVLIEYARVPWEVENAKWVFCVLYDKEQMVKEEPFLADEEFDYALIHISGQNHKSEVPMPPITMMRNSLGIEQGGSGVPLDKVKYNESVKYWKTHIMLK